MQATPINPTKKLEELKATRNQLFKRFLRHPTETRLALEIKCIDDRVAECAERDRIEKHNSRVRRPVHQMPIGWR